MRSILFVLFAWLTRPGPTAVYRGTPMEWPRPALRIYPTFERLPRR